MSSFARIIGFVFWMVCLKSAVASAVNTLVLHDDAVLPDVSMIELSGAGSGRSAAAMAAAGSDTMATVDLMILYTPGVSQYHGSALNARLSHLLVLTNQAYTDSGVHVRLRLVHSAEVNYPDSVATGDALGFMQSESGAFAGLTRLREKHGADLVLLFQRLVRHDDACGMAYRLGNDQGHMPPGFRAYGYAVVRDGLHYDLNGRSYQCPAYSMAHELGHNFGAVHDYEHAGAPGLFEFSYGHDRPGRFATIMSYDQPGIGKFSNPALDCQGEPCGVAGESDNARTLNAVRHQIAAFYPAADAVAVQTRSVPMRSTGGEEHHQQQALIKGLMSGISVTNRWQRLSWGQNFTRPVVLLGPPSYHDAAPGVIRMDQVTSSGADIRFQAWDYQVRRQHDAESVSHLVLEAGRHTMRDGSVWEVGVFQLDGTAQWQTRSFNQAFPDAQHVHVFLTLQTGNGTQAVTVRARHLTRQSFQAALFEQQDLLWSGHKLETVGYLAIYSPAGSGSVQLGVQNLPYQVGKGHLNHQWTPALSGSLKIEEEQSLDDEMEHVDEQYNILGLGTGLFAQDVSSRGGDPAATRQQPQSHPSLEWGTVAGVTDAWMTVPLRNSYQDPMVVAYQGPAQASSLAVVRVRDVRPDRFQLRIQNWDYLGNRHRIGEPVHYLVAEKGQSQLVGLNVEAGEFSNEIAIQRSQFIPFGQSFTQSPAVFSAIVSERDRSAAVTRVSHVRQDGFHLHVQEQESYLDGHGREVFAWIAIEPGWGRLGGRSFEVAQTDVDHTWRWHSHQLGPHSRFPVVLAHLNSFYGSNPALIRQLNGSAGRVGLAIQEEQSLDDEMSHGVETIGVFIAE